jgi:hypothetical protein
LVEGEGMEGMEEGVVGDEMGGVVVVGGVETGMVEEGVVVGVFDDTYVGVEVMSGDEEGMLEEDEKFEVIFTGRNGFDVEEENCEGKDPVVI